MREEDDQIKAEFPDMEITAGGERKYEIEDFTSESLQQSIQEEITRLRIDIENARIEAGIKSALAQDEAKSTIRNSMATDEAVEEVRRMNRLTALLEGRYRLLRLLDHMPEEIHMRPKTLRGKFTGAEAALIPMGLQDKSGFMTRIIDTILNDGQLVEAFALSLSMTVSHMEDYHGSVRPATPMEIIQLHVSLIDTEYDKETHDIVSAMSSAISGPHGNAASQLTTPAGNALILEIGGIRYHGASQSAELERISSQIANHIGNYLLAEPTLAEALQTAIARMGAQKRTQSRLIMTDATVPDGGQIYVLCDMDSNVPRILLREATPENLATSTERGLKHTVLHLSAGLS